MIVHVAVPVHFLRCKIWIDEARDWSVTHEVILLTLAPACLTLDALCEDTHLPRQVVVAALTRLMRHRLVEVASAAGHVFFGVSTAGATLVFNGKALPNFRKETGRRLRLVVERYSGCSFLHREVRLGTVTQVARMQSSGMPIKIVELNCETPGADHGITWEAMGEIVERGGNRRLVRVEDGTARLNSDYYMLIPVADGVPRLPSSVSPALRTVVAEAATAASRRVELVPILPEDVGPRWVPYRTVQCDFDPADIIIGGSAQGDAFRALVRRAESRVVLHSTFLDHDKFLLLVDEFRTACARGVKLDLLWGAEVEDPVAGKNAAAARLIAATVAADTILRDRFRVRMRTTGSHAKIVLADTSDGGWVAAVGSCNWMSSPFQALEASVLLRDPRLVADVAQALRDTVGRRNIADDLANELALTANDLRRDAPEANGAAQVTVLLGPAHEAIMRRSSGQASGKHVMISDRAGRSVRSLAVLPAAFAASRGAEAVILWTRPSEPMTRAAMRDVATDAHKDGVRVLQAKSPKPPAHAKVLLWTPDDVVVTSHNWGSASSNPDFPAAEVGVHISMTGLADAVLGRLQAIYPQLVLAPSEVTDSSK
jgi:cardiolipin synthase